MVPNSGCHVGMDILLLLPVETVADEGLREGHQQKQHHDCPRHEGGEEAPVVDHHLRPTIKAGFDENLLQQ